MEVTTWQALPEDVIIVIYSFLRPHYYFLLIDRQINHLKDKWLALHFKQEFGLSSLVVKAEGVRQQNYLSFYVDNHSWLDLDTENDYRHLIRQFRKESNKELLFLYNYRSGYVKYLISEYCDAMNMDHLVIDKVPLVLWHCVVCGGGATRSAEVNKSYESIEESTRCEPCQLCNAISFTPLVEGMRDIEAIQVTKRV